MSELASVLGVVAVFLLRVGFPIVTLIVLGWLVDRWQTRRNEELKAMMKPTSFRVVEGGKPSPEEHKHDHRKAA